MENKFSIGVAVLVLMTLAFIGGHVTAYDSNDQNRFAQVIWGEILWNASNQDSFQSAWDAEFSAGRGLSADIGEWPSSYGKYVEVAYFNDSYLDNVTGTEKLPQGEYEYRILVSLTENANGTKKMRMHPIFIRNPEGENDDNVTRLLERVTKIKQ